MTVIIVAAACVGRDRELDELAQRCAATATRGTDFIAVVGEPGIGKSSLLRRLADGRAALWARAVPWESEVPGSVLRQLLQENVATEPSAAAAQFVERVGGAQPTLVVIDDAEHADAEVDRRLKSCGPQVRALVEALAILDEGEALGEAARLACLEDPLGAIDEAEAAGLLAQRSQFQPRLRDRLTRAAVVGLMGVRAAGEAHRRAAEIVADPGPQDRPPGRGDAHTGPHPRRRRRPVGPPARHGGGVGGGGEHVPGRQPAHRRPAAARRPAHPLGGRARRGRRLRGRGGAGPRR